jgi:hypothetical protein
MRPFKFESPLRPLGDERVEQTARFRVPSSLLSDVCMAFVGLETSGRIELANFDLMPSWK